jgi:hypothetical protein
MHLYLVTPADGPELSVFAESFNGASELYLVWWLARRDEPLPSFEVKQRNASWPGFDTKLLDEALSLGIAGIGRFDPNNGWTIVSPTYGEDDA